MEIIQYYPFLKAIPAESKKKIDINLFYIPNSYEASLIIELSETLDKNIALYKKNCASKLDIPICAVIESAILTKQEEEIVLKYSEKLGDNCTIAIYDKPSQSNAYLSFQKNNVRG